MSLLIFLPLSASGQSIAPGREGVLADILPPTPGKRLCFARSYSKDHLEAHPKQTVTDIRFQLAYVRHKSDEAFPEGARYYYFRMTAKLRGSSKTYKTTGECSAHGAEIFCGVECDGGGVNLRSRPKGRLLVFFRKSEEIRMTDGCDGMDDYDAFELKPGVDDREFLLDPTSAASCPAYEKW